MLKTKSAFFLALALSALILAGCPNNAANEHPDAAGDAEPTTITGSNSSLGVACNANDDCASGFCTDGVCCDSPCDQTCYACNQQAALGHCAALSSGQDTTATIVCAAPSACFIPSSSTAPACRFVDGTACQADPDCISGHCLTYYIDADGDGYGTSEQAQFCAELDAAPPTGYAAYAGDCCDSDAGANPAFDPTQFLAMPDACGSFDWRCDGVIVQQKSCPTNSGIQCGQACTFPVPTLTGVAQVPLFTEACN